MEKHGYEILRIDPYLKPYEADIQLRMHRYLDTRKRLLGPKRSISAFSNGHLYFGFHPVENGWYYREWAPNAKEIALIGEFNGWNRESHKLTPQPDGNWEIFIPGRDALQHGSKVKIQITTDSETFDRIPLYCKRVIQDPITKAFDGQVWYPDTPYCWKVKDFIPNREEPLLIYECHIGMSSEKEQVSGYAEFTTGILPRVRELGYNAVQLMGVMEHPYYGSFGYQVSNFFASSSRFGTPEELKALVDTAHSMGITVLLDLVHSHAALNEAEGIGRFDGTQFQFFHEGPKGRHPAWGTELFDYGKPQVLHFLLSNIKFWLEEYHFDGFRFDGVTSMLYHDHGLGGIFDHYQKYFSPNTDLEAVTYLQLAAELSKEVNPNSILIAEDMSGMPGMALPLAFGGIGFDYRLAMGMPDFWVRNLRDKQDESWNMGELWHEVNQRRPREKVVGYCESHDQALVGDKTIMFWLADRDMYDSMHKDSRNPVIDRAIALHKMIRLITCMCAGEGYLTFMGNEFGHPEWIDFPREGNNWSYHYARRLWSLADNPDLRYQYLQAFDKAMVALAKDQNLLAQANHLVFMDERSKSFGFLKGEYLFLFNFHPTQDYTTRVPVEDEREWETVLHTSWYRFGGYTQEEPVDYRPVEKQRMYHLEIPLDRRSAVICRKK